MVPKLPKLEISLYFITWVFSFSFSFYNVYLLGVPFELTRSNYFIDGWSILSRRKDDSDDEWVLWTNFSVTLAPWFIGHIIISEITRIFSIEAIPLCYMVITILVLLSHFPPELSAFLIIQLCVFFIGMLTASKCFIWFLGIFYLLLISVGKDVFMDTSRMTDEDRLTSVLLAWFLIRCLDFALSEVKGSTELWLRFMNLLAYTFYIPCFFFGPFIPYEHFKLQVYKTQQVGYKKRLLCLFRSLIKYYLYYLLFEFLSHLLYCNAMHHVIENLISNGPWTLSGIGLCMANFFYLKYIVVYGVYTSIAMYENFTTPDPPKCIYRIHLYSKMWRHFDRGFYLFIFRCIYSPVCGRKNASIIRKSFASFLCFLFVYIWHGGTVSVFYWSLFNFVGLLFEAICRHFWKNRFVNCWLITNLSHQNLRRLEALVASPLWLFAVISNFMFFGGHRMGMLYFEQLFKGSLLMNLSVVMIAYCMCQVSIETDKFEKKDLLADKEKK